MSGANFGSPPAIPHKVSEESLYRPKLESIIPSRSDLSDAGRRISPLYDPQPSSYRNSVVSAFSEDDVDTTHIGLSRSEMQFGAGIPAVPVALRAGPSLSPSSQHNYKSWGMTQDTAYKPISTNQSRRQETGISTRLKSFRTMASRRSQRHPSIPEEGDEMEIGLVGGAYRFGNGGPSYATVDDVMEEEAGDNFGVDLSSFTGPMNERNVQLERNGTLTGGLGAGTAPNVRVSEQALLSSPLSPTMPRRGLSKLIRSGTNTSKGKAIKDIAQAEANRLGKVIEVVVDDAVDEQLDSHGHKRAISEESVDEAAAGVDLSSFGGVHIGIAEEDVALGAQSRDLAYPIHRAMPLKKLATFYPEANWKPHSMRWPYLTVLVVLSAALAVVQEFVYQVSKAKQDRSPPEGLYTFKTLKELSTWDYFTFKYLPTIIAVTYGVLWQVTDFEVKRLEPYYQLSKEDGALAAESINVDYITIFSFWRPIQAIRFRHWAVTVSSIGTLIAVSAVPVLQAASIVLIIPEPQKAGQQELPSKLIVISGIWSRSLSAVLATIAVLGLIMLFIVQRRKSGLMTDVKGIAGIAAMATKSHILMDFKDLDTVSPQNIHDKLKNHRYELRNSSLAPSGARLSEADKHKYDTHHLSPNPHPFMLRLSAGIPLISGMAAFAAVLPLVLFVQGAEIITSKASWLLTACAVLIKIGYQTLEQDLRMMEPFYRLSCRHASPKVLTLDYTSMAFAYMPLRAMLNGDLLVAFVGIGSVLAEILTVCVTSFAGVTGADFIPNNLDGRSDDDESTADNGEETMLSFWVSFSICTGSLIYLILTASLTYRLRRHPFLPRQPSTIASVLAYIHQSKMLYDFVDEDTSSQSSGVIGSAIGRTQVVKKRTGRQDLDNDEMVRRLTVAGKKYGLGWFKGRDGQTHCGVDVEELERNYRHGKGEDLRLARGGWGWDDAL